jgi:hypothetical protein
MLSPELRTAGPAELAAGVDKLDRSIFAPADAVGEAVVRAIGRVGPVVIPYWWVRVVWEFYRSGWAWKLQSSMCGAVLEQRFWAVVLRPMYVGAPTISPDPGKPQCSPSSSGGAVGHLG